MPSSVSFHPIVRGFIIDDNVIHLQVEVDVGDQGLLFMVSTFLTLITSNYLILKTSLALIKDCVTDVRHTKSI